MNTTYTYQLGKVWECVDTQNGPADYSVRRGQVIMQDKHSRLLTSETARKRPKERSIWLLLALFVLQLVFARGLEAQTNVDWPLLSFELASTNIFLGPTSITHAGDGSGRLFVTGRLGQVWIIQNRQMESKLFLDLSDRVATFSEQGLLSLAFPRGFSTNGHFYACYVRSSDGALTVSRFNVSTDRNLANKDSERTVLAVQKPGGVFNGIHNGGQLAFGPDGFLYMGIGDASYGQTAQDKKQLWGKILRIDVETGGDTYVIPSDNPFDGDPEYAPEIWALGLRNPWKFSFDRLTGDLFIGDVGDSTFEETDFQSAGAGGGQNYGWPTWEGPFSYTNRPTVMNPVAPIVFYRHGSLSAAAACVTGGYVYRGPAEPRMDGVYFNGDFTTSVIWGLKQVGTNWQSQELFRATTFDPRAAFSTFGEGEDGRLYVANYYTGAIFELQDSHKPWPPSFLPASGVIFSNSVIVNCRTPGVTVHYTTNGEDPTETDPFIMPGDSLPVTVGLTNKLRAFRADLAPSDVVTGVFTKKAGTPVFTPPAQPIPDNTPVIISSVTPGASMYYTTDGSLPTTNSTLYSVPLLVSGGTNLSAIAVVDGFDNSAIGTAQYSRAVVARPTFSPTNRVVTNGMPVTISCDTPGALLFYTLDGSPPSTNSAMYTKPVKVDGQTILSVYVVAHGYQDNAVLIKYSPAFTEAPVVSPKAGAVAYGTAVTIACATPDSTIYFTTDGTVPSTNSPVYTGPLVIREDTILNTLATSAGYGASFGLAKYTLVQAKTPVFQSSVIASSSNRFVTVSCATTNAMIRYTLDGSDPDTNSPIYSRPVSCVGPATLKARAYAPELDPSDVQSQFFGLVDLARTVVTTFAGRTKAGLSNGLARVAMFNSPEAICIGPSNSFYVADTGNSQIRKIDSSGLVSSFVSSNIFSPTGVGIDKAGNMFVNEVGFCNQACKVDSNGLVTVIASFNNCGAPGGPWQLEVDPSGNVYLGVSSVLVKIPPEGEFVVVNSLDNEYLVTPRIGVGISDAGGIFLSKGSNIFQVTPTNTFEVVAGGANGVTDGPSLSAGFESVYDIVFDSANDILVGDLTRVRKINQDGWVSTLAGTGVAGYRNGPGSVAQFGSAAGLCVDKLGNVYVADSANNCIRKISPDTAGIGIADDWQMAHFSKVGIDPNDDPDHDGLNNYAEFWAGTDPLDAASTLAVNRAAFTDGGLMRIQWQTIAGKSYLVQRSADLLTWTNLGDAVLGDGTVAFGTDPVAPTPDSRSFYRVILAEF